MRTYTLQMKALFPIGVLIALFGVFVASGVVPLRTGDPYIDTDFFPRAMVGTLLVVLGIIICCAAQDKEKSRRRDFERFFSFDPRPCKQELVGDPQTTVSHKIELLRLRAQSFFAEEVTLQNEKVIHENASRLAELGKKKIDAKREFWEACNAARPWGYLVPASINEPALPPPAKQENYFGRPGISE